MYTRVIRFCLIPAALLFLTSCQTVTDSSGNSYSVAADNGVFKGTMTQSDGKSFPMELKGVNPTNVEYPTLGCAGHLELVTRTMNEVTFREEIERGSCINDGTFVTSMSGRDVIHMKWSKKGKSLTASAVLYRNGKIPAKTVAGTQTANSGTESSASASYFDFSLISRDPAKYILAETRVNGEPSDSHNKTCNGWYCLSSGTSQEVYLPFEITVEIKEPYRKDIASTGKKIQVKLAPYFVAEAIENGRKVTKRGSYPYKVGDAYYGRMFKSYELSPQNNYSVKIQHHAKVPLLVQLDNGTRLETHDVLGSVTKIVRAREGSRYDTSYAN